MRVLFSPDEYDVSELISIPTIFLAGPTHRTRDKKSWRLDDMKKIISKAKKSVRHAFRIPIGDWSGDGHGQCDWYDATATKPIEDVREAFYEAKKKFPEVNPEIFCSQYEDREVADEIQEELKCLGAPIPEEMDDFDSWSMAEIVVWFLNQGDPDLDVRLYQEATVPMLSFCGFDNKNRHIDFLGYGLFE